MYFGLYDSLKPLLLGENPGVAASFLLGWAVTITSGLMSYPIGKSFCYPCTKIIGCMSVPKVLSNR